MSEMKLTPTEQRIMDRLKEGPLLTNHVGGRAGRYNTRAMDRLHSRRVVRLTTVDGRACWVACN